MYEIAIIEDNTADANQLQQYLDRFAKENQVALRAVIYQDARAFMAAFHYQFDIVLLDIDLPDVNGMEVARWLREKDSMVTLLFVTRLRQYAVDGYEVDAMDYLVKPIEYAVFGLKMRRAIGQRESLQSLDILLDTKEGTLRVSSARITYVTISNHHIQYHLTDGTYEGYGTLKQVEEQLPEQGFFRCNSSCIVNLRYVEKIQGPDIYVAGQALGLSRLRKDDFMKALLSWQSGTTAKRDNADRQILGGGRRG